MAKTRSHFTCQSCGHQAPKWLGKCPECGVWGALVEEVETPSADDQRPAWGTGGASSSPVRLREVRGDATNRKLTGIAELDRVLGGGVVDGSLVLLGGDPGIGKSTLLLAALDRLGREAHALYVSGEESLQQTRMRADRLGVRSDGVHLYAETDAGKVLAAAEKMNPSVLVIDSIQTMFDPALGSAPGSITQVREVAGRLMAFAK